MKTLYEFYCEHKGKVSDKWSIYLSEYDRLFSSYRDKHVRMLEIGVQNGGSLEIWSKYFKRGEAFVGCDINPDCAGLNYDDVRITNLLGDINTDFVESEILKLSPCFDLIIDDGSHTSGDIIKSFARFFCHLNDGGIYVIEDLHCSYWKEFDGGLYYPYSSLAFLKRLADIINHEHWGVGKSRKDLLRCFENILSFEFKESDLSEIHSIEFINSICVVRKSKLQSNVLGKRFISGEDEGVVSGHKALHGSSSNAKNQMDNPWSVMISAPDEDFERLLNVVSDRDVQIGSLNQSLSDRDVQIGSLNQSLSDRDVQIGSLNRSLSDRDVQIGSLNQSLSDRDVQIGSLNRSLSDRDVQIGSLNQSLSDRDVQINGLVGNLEAVYNSTSWRIAAPLRNVKKLLLPIRRISSLLTVFYRKYDKKSTLKKVIIAYRAGGLRCLIDRVRAALLREKLVANQYCVGEGGGASALENFLPAKVVVDTLNGNSCDICVDVIVPVYRGLDYSRSCIESVMSAKCLTRYRLVIIDDCSPEPLLVEYLNSLQESDRLIILRNAVNFGFVGTVNRGMMLSDNDVILLNSDTEVSDGWLDKLVWHAYFNNKKVGTVTPFSNNATICSYPTIYGVRSLPPGESLSTINAAFIQANSRCSVEIPTAVGFCMYIRRSCLNEVGSFDEESFGKGYGEENDFCMRATSYGWKHLLAADTYVYHAGEVSFQENSAPGKIKSMEILRSRYPYYEKIISEHVILGEADPFRTAATASRFKLSKKPVVLIIGHALGGGTEKHWVELAEKFSETAHFIVLKPVLGSASHVCLSSVNVNDSINIKVDVKINFEFLRSFIRSCGVTRIHIHHLMGLPESIHELVRALGLPFDFTAHDYFTICPRVNVAIDGRYCGEPNSGACNHCISNGYPQGAHDIYFWRQQFSWVFQDAERVICPSGDVASRVINYHPSAKCVVWPHEVLKPTGFNIVPVANGEPLRIAIIGWLAPHKGLALVSKFVKYISENKLEFRVRLIGSSSSMIMESGFYSESGEYNDSDLQSLVDDFNPHVIWFTSTWPETYSYTLSAAILSGRPLLTPNIGAFPERVSDNPWAWTYRWNSEPIEIAEKLNSIREKVCCSLACQGEFWNNFQTKDIYFEDYLKSSGDDRATVFDLRSDEARSAVVVVETYSGVPSPCAYIRILLPLLECQFTHPVIIRVVKPSEACSFIADMVVTHRVALTGGDIDNIVSHCQRYQIPLVYDLDDDLVGIAESEHPEKDYYSSFVQGIKKLLIHANVVRVSTKNLADRVSLYSHSVKVVPNALSSNVWGINCFVNNVTVGGTVSILYMGTQTHQSDLELVIPALREIKKMFGRRVDIVIIGVTANRDFGNDFEFLDVPSCASSSYPAFVTWLRTVKIFDIGIAPLVASDFNSGKSAIKFFDYSALGLASICSDVPAYRDVVVDGVNGLLVRDDGWEPALIRLIEDRDCRRQLAEASFDFISKNFTISSMAAEEVFCF